MAKRPDKLERAVRALEIIATAAVVIAAVVKPPKPKPKTKEKRT